MHEVLAGAESEKDQFILERLFTSGQILEHSVSAAREGARIHRRLLKLGTMINTMDILIAGICSVAKGEFITLDKNFKKIKEIKVKIIS